MRFAYVLRTATLPNAGHLYPAMASDHGDSGTLPPVLLQVDPHVNEDAPK